MAGRWDIVLLWLWLLCAIAAYGIQMGWLRSPIEWLAEKIRRNLRSLAFNIRTLNEWIATQVGTSAKRVLQVEIGVISALAFTMMEIGENLAAVILWLALCCVWVTKATAWQSAYSGACE